MKAAIFALSVCCLVCIIEGARLPSDNFGYRPPKKQPTQQLSFYQTPKPVTRPPPRPTTTRAPVRPQQTYNKPSVSRPQTSYQAASNIAPTKQEYPQMPYDFNWGVEDAESGNSYSHKETNDGQTTSGQYRVLLPDGRVQIVTFSDNGGGYVAEVTYE